MRNMMLGAGRHWLALGIGLLALQSATAGVEDRIRPFGQLYFPGDSLPTIVPVTFEAPAAVAATPEAAPEAAAETAPPEAVTEAAPPEAVTEAAPLEAAAEATPAVEAETPAETAAPAVPEAAGEAVAAAPPAEVAVVAAADGEKVYRTYCFVCHDTGVANAPKLGDVAAWEPRLAQGREALMASLMNGKNLVMPVKGNCMQCSDDELNAVLDFVLAAAQPE